MSEKEKLGLLEEMMELENGDLSPDMILEELEEWDSMTKLSLVVLMGDEFGKKLTGEDIKKFITVEDILNSME